MSDLRAWLRANECEQYADAFEDVGYYLPEIWRLRGDCLLALDRADKGEARQAFATARDIARGQGAVVFERRAEAALLEACDR